MFHQQKDLFGKKEKVSTRPVHADMTSHTLTLQDVKMGKYILDRKREQGEGQVAATELYCRRVLPVGSRDDMDCKDSPHKP